MGKITTFVNLSLDGFFEGTNHDISWHNVDEEFNQFAIEMLNESEIILFGRRTYQLFEGYWPRAARDPATSKSNLQIADLINNMEKIVFSKSLQKVEEGENWKNVRLVHAIDPVEIRDLERNHRGNIDVGGNSLCAHFVDLGLLDEVRIMVNPIVIGNGSSLLNGIQNRLELKLLETRTFSSGNVFLRYGTKPPCEQEKEQLYGF